MTPKLKKKNTSRNTQKTDSEDDVVDLNMGDALNSPAEAKDEDFDLSMDSARYEGRAGQCGTRSKTD